MEYTVTITNLETGEVTTSDLMSVEEFLALTADPVDAEGQEIAFEGPFRVLKVEDGRGGFSHFCAKFPNPEGLTEEDFPDFLHRLLSPFDGCIQAMEYEGNPVISVHTLDLGFREEDKEEALSLFKEFQSWIDARTSVQVFDNVKGEWEAPLVYTRDLDLPLKYNLKKVISPGGVIFEAFSLVSRKVETFATFHHAYMTKHNSGW